jgi:hypothetical protein
MNTLDIILNANIDPFPYQADQLAEFIDDFSVTSRVALRKSPELFKVLLYMTDMADIATPEELDKYHTIMRGFLKHSGHVRMLLKDVSPLMTTINNFKEAANV